MKIDQYSLKFSMAEKYCDRSTTKNWHKKEHLRRDGQGWCVERQKKGRLWVWSILGNTSSNTVPFPARYDSLPEGSPPRIWVFHSIKHHFLNEMVGKADEMVGKATLGSFKGDPGPFGPMSRGPNQSQLSPGAS